jgi:predicted nucleic acid-binding Zn ribbon protein
MSDCLYCGQQIEGHPEHCPQCGQSDPVPEIVEPAQKSLFILRYESCCRTRLKLLMMLVGIVAFTSYLVAYWLPAGAGPLQVLGFLVSGSFIGAILGVYATMIVAFFLASISSGETISSEKI